MCPQEETSNLAPCSVVASLAAWRSLLIQLSLAFPLIGMRDRHPRRTERRRLAGHLLMNERSRCAGFHTAAKSGRKRPKMGKVRTTKGPYPMCLESKSPDALLHRGFLSFCSFPFRCPLARRATREGTSYERQSPAQPGLRIRTKREFWVRLCSIRSPPVAPTAFASAGSSWGSAALTTPARPYGELSSTPRSARCPSASSSSHQGCTSTIRFWPHRQAW